MKLKLEEQKQGINQNSQEIEETNSESSADNEQTDHPDIVQAFIDKLKDDPQFDFTQYLTEIIKTGQFNAMSFGYDETEWATFFCSLISEHLKQFKDILVSGPGSVLTPDEKTSFYLEFLNAQIPVKMIENKIGNRKDIFNWFFRDANDPNDFPDPSLKAFLIFSGIPLEHWEFTMARWENFLKHTFQDNEVFEVVFEYNFNKLQFSHGLILQTSKCFEQTRLISEDPNPSTIEKLVYLVNKTVQLKSNIRPVSYECYLNFLLKEINIYLNEQLKTEDHLWIAHQLIDLIEKTMDRDALKKYLLESKVYFGNNGQQSSLDLLLWCACRPSKDELSQLNGSQVVRLLEEQKGYGLYSAFEFDKQVGDMLKNCHYLWLQGNNLRVLAERSHRISVMVALKKTLGTHLLEFF